MDDGLAGPFMSLIGFSSNSLQTTFTVTQGVVKGREHRFRYRARNHIGWGAFSDVSAVLAATVPAIPKKPLFVGFTGALMKLAIQPSPDHGGSSIIKYELWVDKGDDFTSTFDKMTNYLGTSLTFDVSPLDALVKFKGRIYRFKTLALNSIGYSDFSEISYIAYGDVPGTPTAPTLVKSTKTSITVKWAPPTTSDLPIRGYILQMDDGLNGDF